MSDLTKWQDSLPEIHIPHRQLAKPLARMEYAALVSRLAMNGISDAHIYAVLKVITTEQQAELLKQSYPDRSPEVEALCQKLTEQYMAQMETITEQVSARMLAELERIPDLGDGSLLSRLRDWLSG